MGKETVIERRPGYAGAPRALPGEPEGGISPPRLTVSGAISGPPTRSITYLAAAAFQSLALEVTPTTAYFPSFTWERMMLL